jgi:uncharacterized circularly permuted ATP-grasp superfamily protein
MKFNGYQVEGFYDELFDEQRRPRPGVEPLVRLIESLPPGDLNRRQKSAESALLNMGVTFVVYGHDAGTEKTWPFDIVPRIITGKDWSRIEAGLKQRITALNHFVDDIYHDQKIIKDGIIPADLIHGQPYFLKQCMGVNPPRKVWCHISGIDLIRDGSGEFHVLEDNLRCPSGVSYVLENRQLLKRTLPSAFSQMRIRPVDEYPSRLLEMLQSMAPHVSGTPVCVLLTPGMYNSAYFEHAYLAQQMGIELVEGADLIVRDNWVYMRTTGGFERVDVIYRRIDDEFLDPTVFNPDSMLGVPGLFAAWAAGRVTLVNAPGPGVADDKAVYAYVPRIIKYYMGEDQILPNVHTYICAEEAACKYVLDNLDKLVVKATNQSGGYGMLVGPHASKAEREVFAAKIKDNPRKYIAQPTIALSRVPTMVDDHFEGRHVDLRPYVLCGEEIYVQPGGLTRVALRKGSLVVNSSQGGGSKDTWVLEDEPPAPDAPITIVNAASIAPTTQ